jgi:hypothetical protein
MSINPNLPLITGTTAMKLNSYWRYPLLICLNVLVLLVLGFYSIGGAAPQAGQPPFANPVDQRADMVRELREIKDLLKEQNALLRGGAAKGDVNNPVPR